MVCTLVLNKKEVKISNVPVEGSPKLIEELCSIGCVQTLRSERENDTTTTIHVRFETEEATGKAMEINGQEVHAHILKAELIVHDNQGQPNVLDSQKDIADCLGKRFAYVSSQSSGDQRFQEHKNEVERKNGSTPLPQSGGLQI